MFENELEDDQTGDEQEEQGELDVETLKQQVESERKRVEKISKSYKEVEAERNSYRDGLAKTKGAIESTGVGKFDENWNFHFGGANQGTKEPTIDDEIAKVKKEYGSGEIETEDYIERITELKATKVAQAELDKRDKASREQQSISEFKAKDQQILSILDKEIPDHNNTGSELFKEMAKIVDNNKHLYDGIDLTKDIRSRALLAREAKANLVSVGKMSQETKQRPDVSFNTIESGYSGADDSSRVQLSSDEQRMVVSLGFDSKLIKGLNNKFSSYEKNGGVVFIES